MNERSRTTARVGVVGGGQLARMMLQAAIDLDVELVVMCPESEAPAIRAGANHQRGNPDSREDLARLAAATDVVTFDHELVPPAVLASLEARGCLLRPGAEAKRLAQDKRLARETLAAAGLPVPAWAPAPDATAIERFASRHSWPLVLKARGGGYDGRGVWTVTGPREAARVLDTLPRETELLVEEQVEITRELAVLVARRPGGEQVVYPVVETVQRDGICREVIAPAGCTVAVAVEAQRLAAEISVLAGATGIVCVELFQSPGGLLVNELAMRPHNSGHLTMDAFETSQFENHLRAILDWPLGSPELTVPAAAMVNVLGAADGSDPAGRLGDALKVSGARVRLYGKDPRPGRKLGHVSVLGVGVDSARERALAAAAAISDA